MVVDGISAINRYYREEALGLVRAITRSAEEMGITHVLTSIEDMLAGEETG